MSGYTYQLGAMDFGRQGSRRASLCVDVLVTQLSRLPSPAGNKAFIAQMFARETGRHNDELIADTGKWVL